MDFFHRLKIATSLGLLIILSSCSTLSKQDCESINWLSRGTNDAAKGVEISQFNKYAKECSGVGVNIPKGRYQQGYQEGLVHYCNYEKGYNRALDGDGPFKACDNVNEAFSQGYAKGFEEYKVLVAKNALEETQNSEREKAVLRIMRRFDSKQCTASYDCRKDGECQFDKCAHDGARCTFNSDCKIIGQCKNEMEFASAINEWVHARVCEY